MHLQNLYAENEHIPEAKKNICQSVKCIKVSKNILFYLSKRRQKLNYQMEIGVKLVH